MDTPTHIPSAAASHPGGAELRHLHSGSLGQAGLSHPRPGSSGTYWGAGPERAPGDVRNGEAPEAGQPRGPLLPRGKGTSPSQPLSGSPSALRRQVTLRLTSIAATLETSAARRGAGEPRSAASLRLAALPAGEGRGGELPIGLSHGSGSAPRPPAPLHLFQATGPRGPRPAALGGPSWADPAAPRLAGGWRIEAWDRRGKEQQDSHRLPLLLVSGALDPINRLSLRAEPRRCPTTVSFSRSLILDTFETSVCIHSVDRWLCRAFPKVWFVDQKQIPVPAPEPWRSSGCQRSSLGAPGKGQPQLPAWSPGEVVAAVKYPFIFIFSMDKWLKNVTRNTTSKRSNDVQPNMSENKKIKTYWTCKYSDKYLKYGFISVGSDNHLPLRVICHAELSNECMKSSKLKGHLECKHPEYAKLYCFLQRVRIENEHLLLHSEVRWLSRGKF
ncbi:uncharacterized protein LOC142015112 [Carettochelys insculpta]|uniref:uncharacterized protein LOC142015112 n=1 Tax=Carettochelys insculpta TaxID=44489 RepID=UPI003EB8BC7D